MTSVGRLDDIPTLCALPGVTLALTRPCRVGGMHLRRSPEVVAGGHTRGWQRREYTCVPVRPGSSAKPLRGSPAVGGVDGATHRPPQHEASEVPSEDDVRRWLGHLHQPDLLAQTNIVDVLRNQGRLSSDQTGVDLGRAAATLLAESIERLKPAPDASPDQKLIYRVLQTRYLLGLKHAQAAHRLDVSSRQLSRWAARAVTLLTTELAGTPLVPTEAYRFTPIPAIIDFQARPAVTSRLRLCLTQHRYAHVHGPKGIGKTSLVAELAIELQSVAPVLWYRFRPGINDSAATLLFEIAEHLRMRSRPDSATALAHGFPAVDIGLISRLMLRELSGMPLILVLDDYHFGEHDPAIAGFLDDAVTRLTDLRVITIGRHTNPPQGAGATYVIPPMSRLEAQQLLAQAGVEVDPAMAEAIRRWTTGVPQLIRLAASWLAAASESEVTRGLAAFNELDEVQDFLLGSIAELIDTADRAVLDAASIFRRYFSDEALAYVIDSTVGAVRDTSRRLVHSHVATRSRNGDVAFFHTSIREYFYQRLTPESRPRLHLRAADWYARHGSPDEARHHRHMIAGRTADKEGR